MERRSVGNFSWVSTLGAANNPVRFVDSIVVITSIKNTDEIINPTELILHQNYPNPFNPGTTISWQTPVSTRQTLKVYDLLGNEVAILVDEYKPAGSYEVDFDTSYAAGGLASGVYFYQLRLGDFVETKKMILIRLSCNLRMGLVKKVLSKHFITREPFISYGFRLFFLS